MIELVHPSLAELSSKAKLVIIDYVGGDVRQVPSQVRAAFRGGDANLFKPGNTGCAGRSNRNIRRAKDRLAVIGGVWAQEQSQRFGIKTVIEIVEQLVEVVGAEEHLVRQFAGQSGIQHERIVLHV